jgi:hypothetical protein
MERRLFPDGGYHVDNGASVCSSCHVQCEMTTISTDAVRAAASIAQTVLPPHFYADAIYDKWGNIMLPNGQRVPGELFHDPSVQKILDQAGILGIFTNRVKYPRTHHVPWSGNITSDDRVMDDLSRLETCQDIVVTEKMDGENTTWYRDGWHARSLDTPSHPSRTWAISLWSSKAHDIPDGWRLCLENCFAKHSIGYTELPSYVLGFSIWNERMECLSWDDTAEWYALLDIPMVPVLYRGPYRESTLRDIAASCESARDRMEGYVVRPARAFHASAFRSVVGKYVRRGHVQTVRHWMHGQPLVKNHVAGHRSISSLCQ